MVEIFTSYLCYGGEHQLCNGGEPALKGKFGGTKCDCPCHEGKKPEGGIAAELPR